MIEQSDSDSTANEGLVGVRRPIDVSSAAARRRFYIDRARRKNTRGSGSDMEFLMTLRVTRKGADCRVESIFGTVPIFLIGAYAAAAYAPERVTTDVGYFTTSGNFAAAEEQLVAAGWTRRQTLVFPNAKLGLFGSAWRPQGGGMELDLIASEAPWAQAAFDAPISVDRDGRRVMPLAFLVLMKLDSARGTDQGDLNRMLGRLSEGAVEDVVAVVERYYDDPAAGDDIRQSAEIGSWEYETEKRDVQE